MVFLNFRGTIFIEFLNIFVIFLLKLKFKAN